MRRNSPVDHANNRIDRHCRIIRQKNNREHDAQETVARVRGAKISFRAAADGTIGRAKHFRTGHNIRPAIIALHRIGAGVQNQPTRRRAIIAAGSRLRRRLSKIFQRLKTESGLGSIPPPPTGTEDLSQSMICQSPRDPAVLPTPPRDVTIRVDIQQLDVCRQSHSDVASFQQVMAQQVRRWKST